jgi:hypothetical protein
MAGSRQRYRALRQNSAAHKSRLSTSSGSRSKKDVDGRNKSGHDELNDNARCPDKRSDIRVLLSHIAPLVRATDFIAMALRPKEAARNVGYE